MKRVIFEKLAIKEKKGLLAGCTKITAYEASTPTTDLPTCDDPYQFPLQHYSCPTPCHNVGQTTSQTISTKVS